MIARGNFMRAICLSILCGILLSGCNETTTGQQFGITSVRQIETGKTDKATVRQLLGPAPQTTITGKNEETWAYVFSSSGNDAQEHIAPIAVAGFLPVVGVVPALTGTGNITAKNLTERLVIVFKGNIVSSCVLTRSSITSTAATGLMNSGNVSSKQESHDIPCNQVTPPRPGQT